MVRLLIFLLVVNSAQAIAQTYPVTNIKISLPENPQAYVGNWGRQVPAFAITATANLVDGKPDAVLAKSTVLVILKRDGAKVCGHYTGESAPLANFNALTKAWNGDDALKLIGQDCQLSAGDYEISVLFFGFYKGRIIPLSEEKTRPFSIKGNGQPGLVNERPINQQVGTVNGAPDKKPQQGKNTDHLVMPVNQIVTAVTPLSENTTKLNKQVTSPAITYYTVRQESSRDVVSVVDTLFLQIENNYSSGSNQFSYTIRNPLNNRTSKLTRVGVIHSNGMVRFALPLGNSVVSKGQAGILMLGDYKKYYYISFKRN